MNEVMSEDNGRLANVIEAIDAANARDPNKIEHEGRLEPAELVYGWRMSATLARISTEAPVHLRIAARGQHIERWTVHRNSYPAGRIGYLRWRRDLQDFHANPIGEIMAIAGYDAADIGRVRALLRKERLKSDADRRTLTDQVRRDMCLIALPTSDGGSIAPAASRYLRQSAAPWPDVRRAQQRIRIS
jgi:hypothetical protein